MRQIKVPIAGNSKAIAKIGNAELAHFSKQMLIHELIRGSLVQLAYQPLGLVQRFDTGGFPVSVFTDVTTPTSGIRLPMKQARQMTHHTRQRHSLAELLLDVGIHPVQQRDSVGTGNGLLLENHLVDIVQQVRILIRLPPEHDPIDML